MRILKKIKSLFFPIAYYPETEFYGKSKINAHIIYAEQLAKRLSEHLDLRVVRDVERPDLPGSGPALKVNKNFSGEILNFWKQLFFLRGAEGYSLSRDPLFNMINFSFLYDGEEIRNALLKGNEKVVFFNKSESFIFASLPELEDRFKVLVIHDYYIERRKSLANTLKCSQALTHIVDGYEKGGFTYADAIICLSENERIEIQKLDPEKPVVVYRPDIPTPKHLSLPRSKTGVIKLSFVSVNHFVARQTLLKLIESVRGQKELILNLAGTICDFASTLSLPENVVLHGYIENLNEFMSQNDFFAAPIEMGSGFPMKVATALSCGLPVLGTRYLEGIASEFSGKMLFPLENFNDLTRKIREIQFPSDDDILSAYRSFAEAQDRSIQKVMDAISKKIEKCD